MRIEQRIGQKNSAQDLTAISEYDKITTSYFITSNLVMSFWETAVFAVKNEFLDSRFRGNDSYEMACKKLSKT